jgi:damage-control phosphatase, subfamily I
MIEKKACTECCRRQIYHIGQVTNTDPAPVLKLFNDAVSKNMYSSAPEYAEFIFDAFNNLTGVSDPYKKLKDDSNIEAIKIKPLVEKLIPFKMGTLEYLLELAIAGNMIDYGARNDVDIEGDIKVAISGSYFKNDINLLKNDLAKAKSVLYIGDNCGEIIFDADVIKFLKESGKDVVFSVRGKPVINDVTEEDAIFAGINNYARIINTGAGTPGIIQGKISEEFKHYFYTCDVVISKGQGNFETIYLMNEKPQNLYYLFVAKCQCIADLLGCQMKEKFLWRA